MQARDIAQLAAQSIFVLVFVLMLIPALRRRRPFELSVAAFFGAVTAVIALGQLRNVAPDVAAALGTLPATVLLLGLPYLFLRAVSYLARVSRLAMALSFAGWVITVAAVLVAPGLPAGVRAIVSPLIIVVFAAPLFAASFALFRARRRSRGITRRRLEAIALGTLFLALIFFVARISSAIGVPLVAQVGSPALQLASATAYFIGFCLPGGLRRVWQHPQLRAYLAVVARPDPRWDAPELARRIQAAAAEVTGAHAVVGLAGERGRLVPSDDDDTARTLLASAAVRTAFAERRAVFALSPMGERGAPSDVAAVVAAPIVARDAVLGVLVLHTESTPLFADDDVDLARTLADQASVALENVRLHADLRAQTRALEEAQRVAGIGSWYWDIRSGATEWSDELYRIYGRAPGSRLPAGGALELVAPVDYERVNEVVDAAIAERQPYAVEHRIVLPDGRLRWIGARGEILVDAGEVVGVRGTAQDLTDRKAAEEAQRRLAAIVESSSDAIWATSLDGRVLSWNPGAERLFGYTADEIVGKPVDVVVPPERRHRIREMRAHVRAGGRLEQYETTLIRKDEEPIEVAITISPLLDADGTVIGASSIGRDIGERKSAERMLEHRASHDALTELPNRSLLRERLDAALSEVRGDEAAALLMIDLDRFKPLNDAFGHAAGDAVLRVIAGRLVGKLRPTDTVARLGGDEFAVVLPRVTRAEAERRAASLLAAIREPIGLGGRMVEVSASVGIALHPPDGNDADLLLRYADLAMYAAKRSGRGVVLYSSLDATGQAPGAAREAISK